MLQNNTPDDTFHEKLHLSLLRLIGRFNIAVQNIITKNQLYSRHWLLQALENPGSNRVAYYSKYLRVTCFKEYALGIHIKNHSDFIVSPFKARSVFVDFLNLLEELRDYQIQQKQKGKPIIIDMSSFWLRQRMVRQHLEIFCRENQINFEIQSEGILSLSEYSAYTLEFGRKQLRSIESKGIARYRLTIPLYGEG